MTLDVRACSTRTRCARRSRRSGTISAGRRRTRTRSSISCACSSRERVHAAYDGDRVSRGAAAFALDLTVPGGQVTAAGVTVIGVLPTDRRRGASARHEALAHRCRARAANPSPCCGPRKTRSTGSSATAWRRWRPRSTCRASTRRPLRSRRPRVRRASCRLRRPSRWSRRSMTKSRASRRACSRAAPAWWQDRTLVDQPWQRRQRRRPAMREHQAGGKPAAYALYRRQLRLRARRADRQGLRRRGDGRNAPRRPTRFGASCSTSTGSRA